MLLSNKYEYNGTLVLRLFVYCNENGHGNAMIHYDEQIMADRLSVDVNLNGKPIKIQIPKFISYTSCYSDTNFVVTLK